MRLWALVACALLLGAAAPSQPPQQADQAQREQQATARERPAPPVVVQVVPASKTEAEAEAEKRDNQRKAEIEGKALVTNVALAVFAFLQLVVTGITLFGLRHAKTAAEAADKAADETKRSVDTLVASERAYVFFLDTRRIKNATHPAYRVIWHNFGKTPAFVTGVRLGTSQEDGGADPATMPRYEMPFGAVIGASDAWPRGQRVIEPDLLKDWEEQARPIWLCGEITYRDIHGKDHRSWFCRMYNGAQFILDDSADPAFNGYN